MALPFLDHKKVSSVIIARSKPDGGTEERHNLEEGNSKHAAVEALMAALSSKDVAAASDALEAFCMSMDSDSGNFEQGDY